MFVSVKPETCQRLPGSRDFYEVNYAAQRGHVRANLDVSLSALWKLPWGERRHDQSSRWRLSVAHEPTRPKKELTRVSLVDDAQIQNDHDAPACPYPVLDRLAIMAEDPKQPHKVAFEVREARYVRGLSGIHFSAIRGRGRHICIGRWPGYLDLPEVDAREENIQQTKCL